MIVEPKVRGFICTTSHAKGCAEHIRQQIAYVKEQPRTAGPKKVLVIGASTGYGLASRIAAAFSCGAATLGVVFEKAAAGKRTASAGWYNTAAFETFANEEGLYAKTINGDGFSEEIKKQTIETIKKDFGKVDMVVYSLAAPRRAMPDGTVVSSVLKTTGKPYTNKTIDLRTGEIHEVTVEPANEDEIENTVKVMGGEDWKNWITALKEADALEDGAVTVAYSYIGPEMTHPIYKEGSIGKAKEHLHKTAQEIAGELDCRAYISVNKALVTQSSAAIPVVPLYISILYKIMKEKGIHEGCTRQMYRMFHDKLFGDKIQTDAMGMIRMDDLEMREDVQKEVLEAWEAVDDDNLKEIADVDGYWEDFYHMFGFHLDRVDYSEDIDIEVSIPSMD